MSYSYEQRKRSGKPQISPPEQASVPGPDLDALKAGAAMPTAAQKGTPFDLDAAMKAKMERAFGDLSSLKLYRSQAVADAGAEAVAQGDEIAFAPGKTDFHTRSGQERLGHELSHVISQRSGQVRGSGFLNNAALEARADREGAMAAAGEQVYGGAVMPLSSASAASAAGPMQAKRDNGAAAWAADKERHKGDIETMLDMPEDDPDAPAKRPWEYTREELEANRFNPGNSKDLAAKQLSVDQADSPQDAYKMFSNVSVGSGKGTMVDKEGEEWDPTEVDPKLFKAKLKNMQRMIQDYPELEGKIGNMEQNTSFGTSMSTGPSLGGGNKANITYNPAQDKQGFFGSILRFFIRKKEKISGFSAAPTEYDGTHEMGHVINSMILKQKDKNKAINDWSENLTADNMVYMALQNPKVLPKDKRGKVYWKKDNESKDYPFWQIDFGKTDMKKLGLTSGYGGTNAAEFVAEAFADVYAHGADARPASIELLKRYEKVRGNLWKNNKRVQKQLNRGKKKT